MRMALVLPTAASTARITGIDSSEKACIAWRLRSSGLGNFCITANSRFHSAGAVPKREAQLAIWSADLSAYIHQLAELRRQHAVIQQGELSWRSVGNDGLVAQAEGWELWINRSRHEAVDLPEALASAQILWSTADKAPTGAIATQSAALLLTAPK